MLNMFSTLPARIGTRPNGVAGRAGGNAGTVANKGGFASLNPPYAKIKEKVVGFLSFKTQPNLKIPNNGKGVPA